jgi:membrane fusion protein (multidrug efflux system)
VPVAVVKLAPTAVQEDLQAVGSLRSNESVMLRPEVSGRIAAIGFRDGQAVRKGEVLVGLDASLQEAEVVKARAELDLAQSNLKRTEDLARKNFVSGSAQEQAASNAQVAAANLKLAEARLAKMRLIAPFDGVAGIRSVSVGDYVKEGADLVNLEDIGTLKVDYRLPERAFEQVRVGLPVEVAADALPGERFAGTIEAINPRIDAGGRSLEVRARLANRGGNLRPGMFVRVRTIVGSRPNALLVPEEAIVPAGEDFYVFRVVERDGQKIVQRVKVRTGVRRDGLVELTDGVAAGDLIVTAGSRLGRDGQPVRVVDGERKG